MVVSNKVNREKIRAILSNFLYDTSFTDNENIYTFLAFHPKAMEALAFFLYDEFGIIVTVEDLNDISNFFSVATVAAFIERKLAEMKQ